MTHEHSTSLLWWTVTQNRKLQSADPKFLPPNQPELSRAHTPRALQPLFALAWAGNLPRFKALWHVLQIHCALTVSGTGVVNTKLNISGYPGSCCRFEAKPSQFFCLIWQFNRTYNSLRCLHLEIWRFSLPLARMRARGVACAYSYNFSSRFIGRTPCQFIVPLTSTG